MKVNARARRRQPAKPPSVTEQRAQKPSPGKGYSAGSTFVALGAAAVGIGAYAAGLFGGASPQPANRFAQRTNNFAQPVTNFAQHDQGLLAAPQCAPLLQHASRIQHAAADVTKPPFAGHVYGAEASLAFSDAVFADAVGRGCELSAPHSGVLATKGIAVAETLAHGPALTPSQRRRFIDDALAAARDEHGVAFVAETHNTPSAQAFRQRLAERARTDGEIVLMEGLIKDRPHGYESILGVRSGIKSAPTFAVSGLEDLHKMTLAQVIRFLDTPGYARLHQDGARDVLMLASHINHESTGLLEAIWKQTSVADRKRIAPFIDGLRPAFAQSPAAVVQVAMQLVKTIDQAAWETFFVAFGRVLQSAIQPEFADVLAKCLDAMGNNRACDDAHVAQGRLARDEEFAIQIHATTQRSPGKPITAVMGSAHAARTRTLLQALRDGGAVLV